MTEINIPFIKGNQEIAKKIMEEFHRPKEMDIYIYIHTYIYIYTYIHIYIYIYMYCGT